MTDLRAIEDAIAETQAALAELDARVPPLFDAWQARIPLTAQAAAAFRRLEAEPAGALQLGSAVWDESPTPAQRAAVARRRRVAAAAQAGRDQARAAELAAQRAYNAAVRAAAQARARVADLAYRRDLAVDQQVRAQQRAAKDAAVRQAGQQWLEEVARE